MKRMENANYRIERHLIKSNHDIYYYLIELSKLSNNLYNHANFIIRQNFFYNLNKKGKSKYLSFYDMDKILRKMEEPNYQKLPKKTAQQILRVLHQNWQSFFKSIQDYKTNKNKYKGRPKPPKYRKSGGLNQIILTNQQCKIKNGVLHFPKIFKGLTLNCYRAETLTDVKIIPNTIQGFDVLIGYKMKEKEIISPNNHYLSIDLGLDNFIAMTSNQGLRPVIVNGKGLKSKNQYFNSALLKAKLDLERCQNGVDYSVNRQIERLKTKGFMKNLHQSDFELFNNIIEQNKSTKPKQYMTKRMYRLYHKRHYQMMDFFHKVSRFVVDYCLKHNISQVIIGHNLGQKQQSHLKNFNQIPIFRFINILDYKLREYGIILHQINESYTSGTSFLDNEYPNKTNYNKSRRIQRGLFESKHGLINSDVNGALQIMKKFDEKIDFEWNHNYFNPIKMSNTQCFKASV